MVSSVSELGQRLNRLFAVALTDEGMPLTNDDLVAGVAELGVKMSRGYVSQMRNGIRDNPNVKVLTAIAEFFGIDPAYFIADPDRAALLLAEYRRDQLQRLRGDGGISAAEARLGSQLTNIALRAGKLSPRDLEYLTATIDRLLDPDRADPPDQ